MKSILSSLFLTGLLCMSCTDRDDEVNLVNIRIKNISGITYDEVQVGEQEILHMNIAPGDFSQYLEYEAAYQYAYISIKSGEETYVLQPIDYVGETTLPVGFYTYALDITEEGEVLLVFSPD